MSDFDATEIKMMLHTMRDDLSEVRDRARRTETRLTRYLERQGMDTRATKPRYDHRSNVLHLPSIDCSLRDIIDAIPSLRPDADESTLLVIGKDEVAEIYIPTRQN